jgi:hypothetical protein
MSGLAWARHCEAYEVLPRPHIYFIRQKSSTKQITTEAPKPMNQVPTGSYNRILRYTGCLTLSDLAKSPWLQLNGSHKNSIIHTSNLRATHATLQPRRYKPIEGLSSVFPNGGLFTPNANGVGTSTTTHMLLLQCKKGDLVLLMEHILILYNMSDLLMAEINFSVVYFVGAMLKLLNVI